MELDITSVFCAIAPRDYSASAAELGQSAGADTWRAACEDAPDHSALLDTEEKRDAFRRFVRESGGWSGEEIAAWSDQELTALFPQWIAGDMRELGINEPVTDVASVDWDAIRAEQEAGQAPSNIGPNAERTRVYFTLS